MQCFQKAHASVDLVVSLIPSIEPDEKLPYVMPFSLNRIDLVIRLSIWSQ